MEIKLEKNIERVKELVKAGYCPVECSFGNMSVVDDLKMDHHGEMSAMESVAIRAYRDFFGIREEDPRFVVNHIDADCIFAISALAGMLPHPESKFAATQPAFKQKIWFANYLPLAETIATIDTDPIGRDVLAMPYGDVLVTWNSLFGMQADDDLAAMSAVQGWKILLTMPTSKTFIAAAQTSEANRRNAALADLTERGKKEGAVMSIIGSRVFGFAEWYDRQPNLSAKQPEGWNNPIVVSLSEQENITFGMPNKDVAEAILGKGGLQNVFTKLNQLYALEPGNGFGGREAVGGSPRGRKMNQDDLAKIVTVINELLSK